MLELELRRRGVPFVKYGGLRFLEAAHVRDLIAALRVLDNPADDLAWFRLLQLLDGVGPATARRLAGELRSTPLAAAVDLLPARAREDAAGLAAAMGCCTGGAAAPGAQVEALVAGLEPLLRRRYEDAEVRLRDLEALAVMAAAFDSRSRLTAELLLDPPASTADLAGDPHLEEDWLTLSTVHSAKGREWRAVHVIHATDGMFPSDLATGSREGVEEERRLFYVALTRAQEHLSIYAPLRYHHHGPLGATDRHSYAQRSRFLPPATAELMDVRPVRSRSDDMAGGPVGAHLPSEVDRCLRQLW